MKVAVTKDDPYPATVAVEPLIDATDVVADEYVQSPGVLDVGAVRGKLASPYVFVTPLHEKVGVALAIEIAVDAEDADR